MKIEYNKHNQAPVRFEDMVQGKIYLDKQDDPIIRIDNKAFYPFHAGCFIRRIGNENTGYPFRLAPSGYKVILQQD